MGEGNADLWLVAHNPFMDICLGTTGESSKSKNCGFPGVLLHPAPGPSLVLGVCSPELGELSRRNSARRNDRAVPLHSEFCASSGGGAGGRAGIPLWLFAGNGHTVFREWGAINTVPSARSPNLLSHSASNPGRISLLFFFSPKSYQLRLLASVKAAILIPPAEEE